MSLATIQTDIWKILQVAAPTAADNVLLLSVFNHVRLDAERRRDFVAARSVAYLRVAATTGSSLSDAKVGYTVGTGPSGSASLVKSIRSLRSYDSTNAVWVPATLIQHDIFEATTVRAKRQRPEYFPSSENAVWEEPFQATYDTRNLLIQDGLTVEHLGDVAVDYKLRINKWLDAYASTAAPDDFLITYGSDYILWATIAYLNHEKGVFLPKNEGSLSDVSPKQMAADAWESLCLWDSYLQNYSTDILSPG